jgi:hypothetical protein
MIMEPVQLYAWRLGPYLISTETVAAAETGEGYFIVARGDFKFPTMELTYVGTAFTLEAALAMAREDDGSL